MRGLEKAHCSGVLHCELKPGNIMLTKSGAKLMDFGLAKAPVAAVGASRARTRYPRCCSADRRRKLICVVTGSL